jgi:hypothetical protein
VSKLDPIVREEPMNPSEENLPEPTADSLDRDAQIARLTAEYVHLQAEQVNLRRHVFQLLKELLKSGQSPSEIRVAGREMLISIHGDDDEFEAARRVLFGDIEDAIAGRPFNEGPVREPLD